MELSVESRVKAHISTSYIDVDGRGTQAAYAADYADCMKPPEEFRRILAGDGADDRLAMELEAHCAAVVERSKKFQEAVQECERARVKQRAEEAAEVSAETHAARKHSIMVERAKDAATLDNAYHKRLESDLDMDRYLRLLTKSSEEIIRDHEEAVTNRHAKLKARSAAVRAAQAEARAQVQQSQQHLHNLEQRLLAEAVRQQEEREVTALQNKAKQEYEQIVTDRERDAILQRELAQIRRAKEQELAKWEEHRQATVDAREKASHAEQFHFARQASLDMEDNHKAEDLSYERLKALQQKHEEEAILIQELLKEHHGTGSYLEYLMSAAKGTAEKTHDSFLGLRLLQGATLAPSMLTAHVAPTPVTTKSVAVITNVSEPISSGKKPSRP